MILGQINSGQENIYRKVMQVSDLISMCFDMHKYQRPRLAVAIVALQLMQEYKVVTLD